MCGIVGMVGRENAVSYLIEGLKRLEYRGYDSAGIAVPSADGLKTLKSMGRLSALEAKQNLTPLAGPVGIGHTRWATHGEPSERNSHPHLNQSKTIAVVHNGIIENYLELKTSLLADGVTFLSDTDTEVLTHHISRCAAGRPFLDGFRQALRDARGAYALGVIHADEPGVLYAARLGSPLIIARGPKGLFIASDVPAVLPHVTEAVYLNDGELARISEDRVEIFGLDGAARPLNWKTIELEDTAADAGGFETFMLKEIHEQTRVLRGLLNEYVPGGAETVLPDLNLDPQAFAAIKRIMIVSCGTAYYAAMYGRLMIEKYTSIPVETDLGSEFRYREPKILPGTLVIAVSQSGETADTLASIKMAKAAGCKVLSICNVPGSSLVRESDHLIYTRAGPEIGVASTKAFTAQLMAFALFAIHAANARGEMPANETRALLADLTNLPDAIHYVLGDKAVIESIAGKHHEGPSALYLGRRFNYPIALEGALKNKEISYQHAEGYAAGEMKHGPIALINEYLPVICICTDTEDEVAEKMISNVKEVQARSGRIIAIATVGETRLDGVAEDIIFVPRCREPFSPMVNVVALQLLAYYAAKARGTDIDKPRNLAKSVTVE
ncbi:MAG: glutamine--fructose-6-phosphate transaminase (isomerizing) [Verrucomicrobia bacterium]|nr:glutamine--fructose-6-phosphate transaminase (isomerizing) [Verrucomicrobiota bacterium]MCH8527363.1 glutamine--fructose-6-phosphate transaminase (isomerizing) [Kiritimatiellia bacterium]